jgi:hypothetical protein
MRMAGAAGDALQTAQRIGSAIDTAVAGDEPAIRLLVLR